MIFLPVMKVGGMQFFKSEGFDTLGKIPALRAFDIAGEMTAVYCGITALCTLCYLFLGMDGYDALVLAMSTCSTGGFAQYDASFGGFIGPLEYVASFFMILASIPFIRMVRDGARHAGTDVARRADPRLSALDLLCHRRDRALPADLAQGG